MGFIATWMSSGEKYPFRSLPSTTFLIEQHGLFAYLGDEFLIFTLVVTFFLSWGLFCFSFRVPLLLISGSSSSKSTLNIWKFSIHILLKPRLENSEHYFTGVWDECNCAVVWASFALPFFQIGMKTDLFQSCGHCWVFQISLHIECRTLTALSFRICNSSAGIPSPPLACSWWCFLRPTLLRIPGRLALGEWSHHGGCLGH